MGRKKFSADFQLMFRLLKLFLFIGSVGTLAILFTLLHLTVGDIFASFLAFVPTGWAILQVQHQLTTFSFCFVLRFYSQLIMRVSIQKGRNKREDVGQVKIAMSKFVDSVRFWKLWTLLPHLQFTYFLLLNAVRLS